MITVIGSFNMDLVTNADKIPVTGETVLGREFAQIPGGKGANQAAAIAKLSGRVTMLGAVGSDEYGEMLLKSLKNAGAETKHVIVKQEGSTGVASIIVDSSGNNAITVAPGANYMITPKDIKLKKDLIQASDILLMQLETPIDAIQEALLIAKNAGKTTILNPAPAADIGDFLKYVDIMTPNENELMYMSGGCPVDTIEDIAAAGKKLVSMGVKVVIATIGEKGCVYITEDVVKHYGAYKVDVVDTTAAGDSFSGALALALDEGKSMEDAILFATAVGALTVTKDGAQTSLPTREETDRFIKDNADQKINN